MEQKKFSIVVPVYGAPELLAELHQRLVSVLEALSGPFEIIFVNDACPKGSWPVLQALSAQDSRVVAVNLARNFGQHYAITAGVDLSQGEWVVVMDCDLQDRPEEIPTLYRAATDHSGIDVVFARRAIRHDSFLKRLGSKLFYRALNYMTDTPHDHTIANFGIYHRKVIDAWKNLRERLRFFPVMIHWLGFPTAYVQVDHAARPEGKSGYSFRRLLSLAVNVIIAFSDKPLRLAVRLGFLISLTAFCAAAYEGVRALRGQIPVQGWASLMVSLWFLSGLIIFFLGILGIYIGKIFDQVKGRPLYIIRDILNGNR
jgi:polyisoprenyl-phosphate glycosyltransferase